MHSFIKSKSVENTIAGINIREPLRLKRNKFSVIRSFLLFQAFQCACDDRDYPCKNDCVQILYDIRKKARNKVTDQRKTENPDEGATKAEKKE